MKTKIILGGPGNGKTTELMNILDKELKIVEPLDIAFCSFTKVGCYEGAQRAKKKFKLNKEDLDNFRTIHSFCFRDAEVSRDEMIKKEDYKELGEVLGMKFHGFYTEDFIGRDDEYLFFEQLYRNNKKTGSKMLDNLNPRMVNFTVKNYRLFKERKQIFDFTDLLEHYLKHGQPSKVKVAIIDEAQDLTTLQWAVVDKMFSNVERLYIAGDDDQAIFSWAGADINRFLNLEGEVKILDHSFRLPKSVHKYVTNISSAINNRIDKKFSPREEEGECKMIGDIDEITFNSEESFMILARNKKHLKPVEKYLKERGFVFDMFGEKSINNNLIKAIKAHSNEDRTPADILNINKFCKEEALFLCPWYEEFTKLKPETREYYQDLISNKRELDSNISLNTIHGVKGGEADNVILILDFSKKVYDNYMFDNDSEMRVYYVGASRARKRLLLVEPKTKLHFPKMF